MNVGARFKTLEKDVGGRATLVAVSKTHSPAMIREVYQAGCRNFGENYVQEWVEKKNELSDLKCNWHLIGPLQSNKVKFVVGEIKLIHTVDRVSLAEAISKEAAKKNLVQDVLVQIKTGDEASKSGVLPSEAQSFLDAISGLNGIRILGLMTIPPFFENPEDARSFFKQIREMSRNLRVKNPHSLKEISMGMSHDFEVAIEEGATIVRVGSRIFGERKK